MLFVPSFSEGDLNLYLNCLIDDTLPLGELINAFMIREAIFYMMEAIQVFNANEMEHGKRTVIATFFSWMTVLMRCS